DFADRAVQERLDLAPAPVKRRIRRLRLDRRDALITVPERVQVVRFQLGAERLTLFYCSVGHECRSLSAREARSPPPCGPLWGGVGGGGRSCCLRLAQQQLPPSPALPHKAGQSHVEILDSN